MEHIENHIPCRRVSEAVSCFTMSHIYIQGYDSNIRESPWEERQEISSVVRGTPGQGHMSTMFITAYMHTVLTLIFTECIIV